MNIATRQAVGYCAAPAVTTLLAANAPWTVTTITGILGSIWYCRQLYKDFKESRKKDDETPPR
jgi:hypothetical protein